jgi:hypothetical protein
MHVSIILGGSEEEEAVEGSDRATQPDDDLDVGSCK